MTEYSDHLVVGKHSLNLDETQKKYVRFEERSLKRKYTAFLELASTEAEMHYFFETNPMFIPGLYDLHNGPVGNVVVTKLQLSNEYITDFAFISVNSAISQITLVEIESPTMKVFRDSDDQFSSAFNKSVQQVRDWGLWAEQNSTYLKDMFRNIFHKNVFRYQRVVTRRILIAGRRSDIQKNPMREKRWAGINSSDIRVMSYDRIDEMFSLNSSMLHYLVCRPSRYISDIVKSR